MRSANVSPLTRVIAVLIFASGALTFVLLIRSAVRFVPYSVWMPAAALPPLIFWLAVTGIGLWLWWGSSKSRIVAATLLASQIPVVIASGVTYWWHTPAQLALTFQRVSGNTLLGATTKLGPAASFWFGRPSASMTLGLNLVAIVCLIALLRSRK